MKVQLFTDYACPFCMIQKEILKKFPEVEVEYMYMEIHPEVPEDGGRAEELLGREYIENINGKLDHYGTPYGITPSLNGYMANSRKSLVARAYISLKYPDKVEAYDDAMYKAYNIEGRNIGNEIVIDEILQSVGITYPVREMLMDRDAKDEYEKRRRVVMDSGVRITPSFGINGQIIPGLKTEEKLKELLCYTK